MNVYKIIPNRGNYVFGIALVAAYDEKQAIAIFRTTGEYQNFEWEEYDCSCKLIANLVYNGDKPKMILDCIEEV